MNPGKMWQLEKVLENPQERELCVLGLQAGTSKSLAYRQRWQKGLQKVAGGAWGPLLTGWGWGHE